MKKSSQLSTRSTVFLIWAVSASALTFSVPSYAQWRVQGSPSYSEDRNFSFQGDAGHMYARAAVTSVRQGGSNPFFETTANLTFESHVQWKDFWRKLDTRRLAYTGLLINNSGARFYGSPMTSGTDSDGPYSASVGINAGTSKFGTLRTVHVVIGQALADGSTLNAQFTGYGATVGMSFPGGQWANSRKWAFLFAKSF